MSVCQDASDLTDTQWSILAPLMPRRAKVGRPPLDRRAVLNGISYVLGTGCQWRALPNDFPPWKSVDTDFTRGKPSGLWQTTHNRLRAPVRRSAGKKATPTAAIIDSQSVKSSTLAGEQRGYDVAKAIKGRKRHLVVDTLGLVLIVIVQAASVQDREGAKSVLTLLQQRFRRIKTIFADSAYGRSGLPAWVKSQFGWILQTVLRPPGTKGFKILPKRWIVERTFAWITSWRRFSRDNERRPETTEQFLYVRMTYLMSKRLARAKS